jgi:hypothetical protein
LWKLKSILPNVGENFLPSSETFGEIIRMLLEVEDYEGAIQVCR